MLTSTLLLSASAAWAVFGVGDVVIDPTNLIQTTLSALNTAKAVAQQAIQLTNEATQIQNQMRGLANQARDLTASPLQLSTELQGILAQYQGVLRTAEGLSYDYSAIRQQADTLLTTAASSGTAGSGHMLEQLRTAIGHAMQAQAVVQTLSSQQAALQRALSASQAASGNLAVQQAATQLHGVLATQQATMIELLAAPGREHSSALAAQAVADAQAKKHAADALKDWGRCDNCASLGSTELPRLH